MTREEKVIIKNAWNELQLRGFEYLNPCELAYEYLSGKYSDFVEGFFIKPDERDIMDIEDIIFSGGDEESSQAVESMAGKILILWVDVEWQVHCTELNELAGKMHEDVDGMVRCVTHSERI